MLNSILQTIAEIVAGGTMLESTEQIDFSHPSNLIDRERTPSLNLYLYDFRVSRRIPNTGRQVERSFDGSNPRADIRRAPSWFDVSILITARDRTILGEHSLLSDVLSLLLRYEILREEFLTPELRGYGNLMLSVTNNDPPIDIVSLWNSLSMSIRPAIYLNVTVPLAVWRKTTVPLVTERQFKVKDSIPAISNGTVARRVTIVGIVRNAFTSRPLRGIRVVIEGTEKSVSSDNEGYFFFENLRAGNYALQFKRFGYQDQTCNVLVNGDACSPKEVLLTPSF